VSQRQFCARASVAWRRAEPTGAPEVFGGCGQGLNPSPSWPRALAVCLFPGPPSRKSPATFGGARKVRGVEACQGPRQNPNVSRGRMIPALVITSGAGPAARRLRSRRGRIFSSAAWCPPDAPKARTVSSWPNSSKLWKLTPSQRIDASLQGRLKARPRKRLCGCFAAEECGLQ
jgi:hypothetical protein